MTYTKPEVTALGDAAKVIQGSKPSPGTEFGQNTTQSSYELDE